MKNKKRVFIASSSDLEDERQKLKTLLYDEGFEPKLWEDFDHSIKKEKFQTWINETHLITSDVVIFMVKSRLGEFTFEEFQVAYESLGKTIDRMYVYILDTSSNELSREESDKRYDLKEFLEKEGKLYKDITDYTKLENHFLKQIKHINSTDKIINSLSSNKKKLLPLTKDYLKSNTLQGGQNHFQENFTYTLENSNIFLSRKIEEKILTCVKAEVSKKIILLNGKSGYGKTTLIRQCIFMLLKDKNNEVYINTEEEISTFIENLVPSKKVWVNQKTL